jgi:hypothetical protein
VTVRGALVLANLVAWFCVVGLREPMPARYFDDQDTPGIQLNSAAPIVVVAGRPLRSWNRFHGGETLGVKVVEVVNLVPFIAALIVDGQASVFLPTRSLVRSHIVFGVLLVLTSLQWSLVGSVVAKALRLASLLVRERLHRGGEP